MGILGKFLGKKRDDLGLPDDLGKQPASSMPGLDEPLGSPDAGLGAPMGTPMPGAPSTPDNISPESLGFERVSDQQSSFRGAVPQQSLGDINIGKDLEIISAKLDAIKAELDSMNQRLKRLERLATDESSFSKDKWSY